MSHDWDPPQFCPDCTEPLLGRRKDWFEFCCDPNCIHRSWFGIVPPPWPGCYCGPAAICGGDCHCDHCRWSFGFLPGDNPDVRKSCGNITIDSSCTNLGWTQAQLDTAFARACIGAARCACITYRDVSGIEQQTVETGYGAGTNLLYGYRNLYACLADYCRGKKELIITCADCNQDPVDPNCCPASGPGQPCGNTAQWTNHITLCINNCRSVCKGNVLLHELLHVCGMNDPETYHFADMCVSQHRCTFNPIPGNYSCNNNYWTGPCF